MLRPLRDCTATILPEFLLRATDSTLQMTGAMLGDSIQFRRIKRVEWNAELEILTIHVVGFVAPLCFDGGAWSMMIEEKRLGITASFKLARMTNTYDVVSYDPNSQTCLITLPVTTKPR